MESKKLYTKWTWMLALILFGWMGIAQAQEPVQTQEPALEQESEGERATYAVWDGTQTSGTFNLEGDYYLGVAIELTGSLTLINNSGATVHIYRDDNIGDMFYVEGYEEGNEVHPYTLTIKGSSDHYVILDGGGVSSSRPTISHTENQMGNNAPSFYDEATYGVATDTNYAHVGFITTDRGGNIIHLGPYSNMELEYVILQNNYSDDNQNGGAIMARNYSDGDYGPNPFRGTFRMTNCTIRDCYSRRNGAAMTFEDWSRFNAYLTNVNIHHCESFGRYFYYSDEHGEVVGSYGATISSFGGTTTNMKISNCHIHHNRTGWSGGGIGWMGGGDNSDNDWEADFDNGARGHLKVGGGTQIDHNWADEKGGGIYTTSNNAVFQNITVEYNHAVKDGGGIAIGNYAGPMNEFGGWGVQATLNSGVVVRNNVAERYGGGVFVIFKASYYTGWTFAQGSNSATPTLTHNWAEFNGCQIYQNNAHRGGGICVYDASPNKHYESGLGASGVYERNIYLNNINLHDNTATKHGGGMYAIRAEGLTDVPHSDFTTYGAGELTITIKGGTIRDNDAGESGGGIGVNDEHKDNGISSTCNVYIQNSNSSNLEIYDNQCEKMGGGLWLKDISNCHMEGGTIGKNGHPNTAITGNGGGIAINGGNYFQQNGTISFNEATRVNGEGGLGGGLYLTGGGSVEIENGAIIYNQATGGFGGGFYTNKNSDITISGGSVNHNKATRANNAGGQGGGFYANNESHVLISGGSIDYNYAQVAENNYEGCYGGGFFAYEDSEVTISGGQVNHNYSGRGGGFHVSKASVEVSGSAQVNYNTALEWGGGFNASNSTVTVGGYIQHNTVTAETGDGGGFHSSGDNTSVEITGVISDNTVLDKGGGFYCSGVPVTISGTINNNSAKYGGGGYTDGILTLEGEMSIHDNTASRDGGGLYVNDLGSVSMLSGSVSSNSASHDGGGFSIEPGTGTIDLRGTVENNTASHDGGGAYINNRSVTLQENISYINNIATNNGGGDFMNAGTLTFSNGTVTQNKALNGGGIYLNYVNGEGAVNFNSGTLSNNKALASGGTGGNGGGIYNNLGTITMSNGQIAKNSATNYGGGIYANIGTTNLNGGTIGDSNTAINGAGVYIANEGTLNTGACYVSWNRASSLGGGIYVDHGTTTSNSTIVNTNYALDGGGGIYHDGGSLSYTGGEVTNNATEYTGSVPNGDGELPIYFEGFGYQCYQQEECPSGSPAVCPIEGPWVVEMTEQDYAFGGIGEHGESCEFYWSDAGGFAKGSAGFRNPEWGCIVGCPIYNDLSITITFPKDDEMSFDMLAHCVGGLNGELIFYVDGTC